MSTPTPGRTAGKAMWIVAWLLGLFLATRFFAQWQDTQRNPNQQPDSAVGSAYTEVRLASNGQGHFLASGLINGEAVEFLLDTGATDVAIPAALAGEVSVRLHIPTIGIGASKECAGQVLVLHDMLYVTSGRKARFVRNFMAGQDSISAAVAAYVAAVKDGSFPGAEHCY